MRMVVGACGRQKQGANFSGFKIWCVLFVFLKLEKPLDIQIQLCQELAVRTRNSNATSLGRLLEHTPKPKSILLAVLLKSRSVCLRGITRRAIAPRPRPARGPGPRGRSPSSKTCVLSQQVYLLRPFDSQATPRHRRSRCAGNSTRQPRPATKL